MTKWSCYCRRSLNKRPKRPRLLGPDWESVKSKYTGIYRIYLDNVPSQEQCAEAGKSFHTDNITTKSIRLKYREAVDNGRRSGHGRVVHLFYDLCEKIWGGSPATEQISARIESSEVGASGPRTDDSDSQSGVSKRALKWAPAAPAPTTLTANQEPRSKRALKWAPAVPAPTTLTANQERPNAHSIIILALLKYLLMEWHHHLYIFTPPIHFSSHGAAKGRQHLRVGELKWTCRSVVGVQFGGLCLVWFGSQRSCPPPSFPKAKKLLISCHRGVYRREFRSKKRPAFSFCSLCSVDFTIDHGGSNDLTRHAKCKSHDKRANQPGRWEYVDGVVCYTSQLLHQPVGEEFEAFG